MKFNDIFDSSYYNLPIKIKCILSGKSLVPYCIPKTIKIKCSTKVVSCVKCDIKKNKKVLAIRAVDENILKFIDVQAYQIKRLIKGAFGIPDNCSFAYKIEEMQNLERVFIMPTTGKERSKANTAHIAYYLGYGLEVNTTYIMKGYSTVDPKNQTTTQVFTNAEKTKSDTQNFKLSSEVHKELSQFCISKATPEKVFASLENLYKFYSHNITKIYYRFDLHLAVDISFRSVLSFEFGNEYVHKGWTDVMIIGDTRCGKGYVAEKLAEYFNIGEVISADNCTFAGLVGGLQKIGDHWIVTWGKIPMNDHGLVIIDEASEIQDSDWSRLSRIRSEGIAEITKIHTQVTNSRTRILFISNPVNKTIANYSYGIQSLTDVVKNPEDIARFDYAVVVSHNEVSINDINSPKKLVQPIYNRILERELIMWTWSRVSHEIVFSKKAIKLIYDFSIKLANTYSFLVPLIQGENVRTKIAKVAICFASRIYSNKEKGKYIFIDEVHVECAYIFFNLIYKKDSAGYYAMSKLQKSTDVKDKKFTKVDKYFDSYLNKTELCKCLLMNNSITVTDISEHINQPKEIVREIISTLLKHNCIIKKHSYYVKTAQFTTWLKRKVLKGGGH